ncbi:helix-turn-helix transcriptional regulator [Paraburkholderia fungorum]|uniref:helix-turn-helix transcriptional regulator n=1 Tax=Paraburkholderia fungorum TaxID=134537 RepID=UPI0038BC3E43
MTAYSADELVGEIYEAAMGQRSWMDVGRGIRRLTGAHTVAMWAPGLDNETKSNLLMPFDEMQAKHQYFSHGLKVNPFHNWGSTTASTAGTRASVPLVTSGDEIISRQELVKSAYYHECMREYDLQHVGYARLTHCDAIGLGFSRDGLSGPFDAEELTLIGRLRPHLERGLQLRRQMSSLAGQPDYGRAALEALPGYAMIVSADLRILFANTAAVNKAASASCGLRVVRSGPMPGSSAFLTAAHRDDNKTLAALVLAAASGRSGGAMRIRSPATASLATGLAVLVSPVPDCFVDRTCADPRMQLAKGVALVTAREISVKHSPAHGELLRSLFDLSKAETDVAMTLIGGRSAEDVARSRDVSLGTIRTQIKAVLRKMDALNLRDFERIVASVEAMLPAATSPHALKSDRFV